MTLEQPHNNRCRYVIWQVCNNLYRLTIIIFFCQSIYVYLQYIIIYDLYIIIFTQSILKYRYQICIYLDCYYLARRLTQILCHRTYSRAYLKYHIVLCDAGRVYDFLQNACINKEVLSEFLLKIEIVFLQNLDCVLRISQICHDMHSLCRFI